MMMSSNGFVSITDRIFPDDVALKRTDSPATTLSNGDDDGGSEPVIPPDSPISCVSSRLQEEYDELLKYAVVVPHYNPGGSSNPVVSDTASTAAPALSTNTSGVGTVTTSSTAPRSVNTGSSLKQSAVHKNILTTRPSAVREEYSDRNSMTDSQPSDFHNWLNLDNSVQDIRFQPTVVGTAPSLVESSEDTEVERVNNYMYTVTVDHDVSHMEALMDEWTMELKRKVLAEFGQTKIRILENHRNQMMKQKDVYSGDMRKQVNEVESLKELLHTYEQSIERKDQVIANLTASLQSHRDKMQIQKSFCEWKAKHNDNKREGFASNFANRHYHRTLQRKVWDAWHSLIENRWRQRVERACQAKAQEVCISLTNDYETQLASVNEALEAARTEVQRLHRERNLYEETMKKAFMRGVCALNLEAMTMFHDGDKGSDTKQNDDQRFDDDLPIGASATIPQEFVFSSDPVPGPLPRVVSGHGTARSSPNLNTHQAATNQGKAGMDSAKPKSTAFNAKVISTKVTARSTEPTRVGSASAMVVAPPMTSVIVERHLPVNKQTIGQATASKYPRSGSTQAPAVQRKVGGQGSGGFALPHHNIHTVKVIE